MIQRSFLKHIWNCGEPRILDYHLFRTLKSFARNVLSPTLLHSDVVVVCVFFFFLNSLVSEFLKRVREGVGSLNVPLRGLSLGYSLKTTILVDEYVMGTVRSRAEWKAIPKSLGTGRGGCWQQVSGPFVPEVIILRMLELSGFLRSTCPRTLALSRRLETSLLLICCKHVLSSLLPRLGSISCFSLFSPSCAAFCFFSFLFAFSLTFIFLFSSFSSFHLCFALQLFCTLSW